MKTEFPVVMPLHVNVLLPVLLIVSVLVRVFPTVTLPNFISPDSTMMRVGDSLSTVVAVGAVGAVGAVNAVVPE